MSGKVKAKNYDQLTFSDDFMFCKILQNDPDLCKELTELILGKEIGGIVQIQQQNPIEITADGRGVRFDVYMTDNREHIYDIEMQTSGFEELPKRSRYYQGMIDLNTLKRGDKYRELKHSYVIFICMSNPFPQKGLHKYTFANICKEDMSLELGDYTYKVFLSAEGDADDVTREMRGFLAYLNGRESSTDLTNKLQAALEKARAHEQWRMEYMTLLERDERMREEGRKEGREEGRAEERKTSICIIADILLGTGMPLESVIENISKRYNLPGETVKLYVAEKEREPAAEA